jgi:hypothetical protein
MSKNSGKKRKFPWARDYEIIGVGSFQVLPMLKFITGSLFFHFL